METPRAIRARGMVKAYGDVVALDGVDLDVAAGQVHGLVGPNGAGKTTLLGMLLGLAVPDAGTLEILGRPTGRSGGVTAGVAGFVDGPGLYPSLTARQNLSALARLSGRRLSRTARAAHVAETLARVGLGEVADERSSGFSLGMRQRLGLAAALLTGPALLVLDEPANGLDPAGRHHVLRVIADLASAGTTVVVSSHQMDDLAVLCSEVTVLAGGRSVFSGPVAKLSTECGALDYRVTTTAPARAERIASATPGLQVLAGAADDDVARGDGRLQVRGEQVVLDELVTRLVGAGVAVRELAPTVSPLEAAFLALTGEVLR